jgi:hypothetical protein
MGGKWEMAAAEVTKDTAFACICLYRPAISVSLIIKGK